MPLIRRILAPTDFSQEGESVLEYAAELSARFSAPLVLFHAYALPTGAVAEPGMSPAIAAAAEIRAAIDAALANAGARARGLGALEVHHASAPGDAGTEIVRAARDEGCDLIVMGTHGRSGFRHLLLGSVAEKVIRTAECPVLAVGPRARTAAAHDQGATAR